MSMTMRNATEPAAQAGKRAAPPLLLGAAMLFWGVLTGFLIQAVIMGAALEAISRSPARLDIRPADFSRVLDLCVILFLGESLYLYLTPMETSLLLVLVQWLPFSLFPLVFAESISTRGEVALSTLFYTVRPKRESTKPPLRLRFAPVFGMICVFAAGAANARTPLFFPCAAALLCWWLFWRRPGRYSLGLWFLAALLAAGGGWLGQWSIHTVQESVRNWVRHDPYRRTTAIGEWGELKLSDSIILRVAAEKGVTLPLLLREATYNFMDGKNWLAAGGNFMELPPVNPEGNDWRLDNYNITENNGGNGAAPPLQVTIFQSFYRRGGLLPLPEGTRRIEALPVGGVEQSSLGSVRVSGAPGLAGYKALYAPGTSLQMPPNAVDQVVPQDRETIDSLLEPLHVEHLEPFARAMAIRDYLRSQYAYSLLLEREHPEMSPLAEFLLVSRKGHCEYFAMAAVYMLRAAGIPARYAVGYVVQEYSPEEGMFIVRERHAHAWALAWIKGQWVAVDATPPVWWEEDAKGESLFQDLADLRQRLAFAFARWCWLGEDARTKRILLWIAGPLLFFLLYRLGRRMRIGKGKRESYPDAYREFGLDRVERLLARRGFSRRVAEPWQTYLDRAGVRGLGDAMELYYRARFDPRGLDAVAHRELRKKIAAWLRAEKKATQPGRKKADV